MTADATQAPELDCAPQPNAKLTRATRFVAWLLGVDVERLVTSRPESRYAATAVSILLLMSLVFAFFAAATFAYARLPAGLAPGLRLALAGLGGLVWAFFIGNVDRALLLLGEASRGWRKGAMLLVRLGVAGVLSFFFAEQIILTLYAGPVAIASQQLTIEQREQDAVRLEKLHGLPGLKEQAASVSKQVEELAARRETLPEYVLSRFAEARKCGEALDRQAGRVASLRRALRQDERRPLHDALAQAERRYSELRQKCAQLREAAERAKTDYLLDIDAQLKDANAVRSEANQKLAVATGKMDAEKQTRGQQTQEAYADSSTNGVAFARAMADHPEIARDSQLVRAVLIILDMLPFIIKSLADNIPLFIRSRMLLASEAAAARIREHMSRIEEAAWAEAFARPDVREAWRNLAAAQASALAPLNGLGRLFEQMAESAIEARTAARHHPDHATAIWAAFNEAIRKAFEAGVEQSRRWDPAE